MVEGKMKQLKEWLKRSSIIIKIYECIALKIRRAKRKFVRVVINRPKARHSYGKKNRDKTFFVIPAWEKSGLYSSILLSLPVMEYAIKKGYIPIHDFKNTYNQMMQDQEKRGLENAWDYYYEQPGRVSLEEVYQSKKVIHFSKEAYYVKTPDWNSMFPASDQELQHWHKFIEDNLHLQESIKERIDHEAEKIFAGKKNILGVGVRATYRAMYLLKSPAIEGHPVVPTCEEMIRIVEEKMKAWGSEYIFLSIDDREYHQKFVDYFGDKCLFLNRHLYHRFVNDNPNRLDDYYAIHCEYKGISVREETEEYITEVYLLSMCDSLYSSISGGAQFAYFLNGGKYEHMEVYNEGQFHLSKDTV